MVRRFSSQRKQHSDLSLHRFLMVAAVGLAPGGARLALSPAAQAGASVGGNLGARPDPERCRQPHCRARRLRGSPDLRLNRPVLGPGRALAVSFLAGAASFFIGGAILPLLVTALGLVLR